jgi:hypothetical protein
MRGEGGGVDQRAGPGVRTGLDRDRVHVHRQPDHPRAHAHHAEQCRHGRRGHPGAGQAAGRHPDARTDKRTVRVTFSDFGLAVSVSPPPADQTVVPQGTTFLPDPSFTPVPSVSPSPAGSG